MHYNFNEHSVLGQVIHKMCIWLLDTAPIIMTEQICPTDSVLGMLWLNNMLRNRSI